MSKIEVNEIDKQNGSTLTIGGSGTTVQLGTGATQTGFGRTGTVDWQTGSIKTTDFTAVNGQGFFVNTSGGSNITVTLPSSPSGGNIVAVADYAGTAATNKIIIARNGSPIEGGTENAEITVARQTATLVYVDATQGWVVVNSNDDKFVASQFICASGGTEVTCGNFKTHIFTGPGTFTVSEIAPSPSGNPNAMDYLVVAGGGGGAGNNGGGGGAGGFQVTNCASIPAPTMSPLVKACGALTATVNSFPISVGAAGSPGPFPATANGGPGGNSIFSTVTSAGGGGGATRGGPTPNGLSGGSGGGGGGEDAGSGGSGNTPPTNPAQGQDGGAGGGPSPRASGGGGGAGATGGPGVPNQCAGPGGVGSFIADAFIGPTAPTYGTPGPVSSVRYFSGGGGAGVESTPSLGLGSNGAGGAGGGGQGGPAPNAGGAGSAATVNTGGGGGGASRYNCGSTPVTSGGGGGSGIVMIRYKFQ